MKCNNCGFENEQDFEYCVNCGAKAVKENNCVPVEAVSLNPAEDIVLPALKDKLFMVLCILMTITTVMSFAAGTIPVLQILFTIFLWLTFADAQKGFANEKHLRVISGTVYAQYIIVNVVSGILLVCGALLALLFISIDSTDFVNTILLELEAYGINGIDIPNEAFDIIGIAFALAFVFIAIIMLVFNILMMRKIHCFAKSVYMGLMYQNTNFETPKTVRNWLIFIAVCSGITTISNIALGAVAIITNACDTATIIIATILISKYFIKQR